MAWAAGWLLFVPIDLAGAAEPQPRIWDSEVTIPAGSYREAHPIHLKGEFKVTVQPGVCIEDVKFEGKDKAQHWQVDGDLFRKVKVTGQMSVSMNAKNSGFEDCEFFKEGGWFVDYWSTRWNFENCVFTKKFFHDFGVTDYAIKAVHCTFIGLKLPVIGLKGDPSKYLQHDDLKFENCRFIQCEVPQSSLAATVNCVFEGCQFPAKKHDWPKEMGSVTVQAFFRWPRKSPRSPLSKGRWRCSFRAPAGARRAKRSPSAREAVASR